MAVSIKVILNFAMKVISFKPGVLYSWENTIR